MTVLILLTAGFFCGVINSVAGGGVLIAFPALLSVGLTPITANITTNLITFPGTLAAAFANKKDLRKLPKKYFLLVVPCFLGGLVGYIILDNTSTESFNNIVPWLILTAVLMFAFQPQLHNHLHRPAHMRFGSPLFFIAIGLFIASIYGGYFGAGFGFIMLALLSFTKIKNIFQMTALKNVAAATLGITGTLYFTLAGGISWKYGLITALGCAVGGYVGGRFAHRISPHTIRAVVTLVGLSVAGYSFTQF